MNLIIYDCKGGIYDSKTVKDLIEQLNNIVEYYELYEEDTELILFSEELPGMARQLDYMDVDFNGNYVQLFMRYY